MSKISAFVFVTLNGYFKGTEEDISWHNHGEEETLYSEEMLSLGNILVFGRKTYEMMADFWTSDMAKEMSPKVAESMNHAEKIVFSSQSVPDEIWQNTRFLDGNIIEEMKKLKESGGRNMTILGSGSIFTQFSNHNLIDEYQIMIDPVAIRHGTPLFEGIKNDLNFELIRMKTFSSGTVLLEYKLR